MTLEGRTIPQVDESASLRTALRELDRCGLQVVLVTDRAARLCGLVTDGDVRRALLAGIGLEDPVKRVMNARFLSVDPSVTRAAVLDLMRAHGRQQIPVLDEAGRVVGLHVLRELVGAVKRPNWAVIMAGGRGDRLRPLTDVVPKPMLRVAGRPILERLVLHLVGYGVRKIFVSVHYKAEQIERHFGTGEGYGCEITYLREDHPLHTAGALTLLPGVPPASLLVLNGDLVTNADIGALLVTHDSARNVMTIAVHEHAYQVPYGVIEEGPGGGVAAIQEKPTQTWTVNAGLYVVEPEVLGRIPRGKPFTMPALADDCLCRGDRVGLHRLEDDWIDVGHRRELRKARGEDDAT